MYEGRVVVICFAMAMFWRMRETSCSNRAGWQRAVADSPESSEGMVVVICSSMPMSISMEEQVAATVQVLGKALFLRRQEQHCATEGAVAVILSRAFESM